MDQSILTPAQKNNSQSGTKFAHLKDDELLSHIDGIRHHSPIIHELCTRLEIAHQTFAINGETAHNVECPVCEASLFADYDHGNNMFTLALKG